MTPQCSGRQGIGVGSPLAVWSRPRARNEVCASSPRRKGRETKAWPPSGDQGESLAWPRAGVGHNMWVGFLLDLGEMQGLAPLQKMESRRRLGSHLDSDIRLELDPFWRWTGGMGLTPPGVRDKASA